MRIFRHATLFFIVFAIVVILSLRECAAMILEYKDVLQFKIQTQTLPGQIPARIKVSGLSGHSALSVTKITTETIGSALIIYVHLTLSAIAPETSGRFEYELTIPDSIDEVQFGESKVTIWKRSGRALH